MATNVTEKDKTLQEIIDWCEQLEIDGLRLANALLMQRDTTAYGVVKGQIDAYGKTADHCRSMLGYSGSMLSCLTYEDTDNSDPSDQPQVGDYAWQSARPQTARRKYPSTSNGRNAPDCQSHS